MSILDSFYKVQLGTNIPYLNISNYGLTFNKAVLEIMGRPEFVDVFLDEKGKRLAIVSSSSSSSIPFCHSKTNCANARINNKEFARKLFSVMHWQYKNVSYKVQGVWISEESVLVFNMEKATRNIASSKLNS